MKILAVDDDSTILELLSEALDVSGFEDVSTAGSAADALALLAQTPEPFDCFLLDIQMPNINGIELCARIRDLPDYGEAPIIMVTAMSQKAYIDKAFSAGATDYVTKPFDILELGARLNMAAKLVAERKRVRNSQQAVDALKAQAEMRPIIGLSEPVEIHGIDRSVGYVSFENYILQLSRSSLFLSGVCAVKISNIDAFYATASDREYREFLSNVASILSDTTEFDGGLFSYRGNGVFVCLRQSGSKQKHGDFREALGRSFDKLKSANPASSDLQKTGIVLGDQASLAAFSKAISLNSIHRAIEMVENKCLEITELEQVFDKKHRAEDQSDAERDLKREAYAAILADCLREGDGAIQH